MDPLEGALADAGHRRMESAAEAAAKAAEAAAHRQKLIEGVRLVIDQHKFTVEELFPAQPAATDDVTSAPADVGEWDEPKLTSEAESLYRDGKSDTEVADVLKPHQPDAMLRAKAQQAGKTAAESGT